MNLVLYIFEYLYGFWQISTCKRGEKGDGNASHSSLSPSLSILEYHVGIWKFEFTAIYHHVTYYFKMATEQQPSKITDSIDKDTQEQATEDTQSKKKRSFDPQLSRTIVRGSRGTYSKSGWGQLSSSLYFIYNSSRNSSIWQTELAYSFTLYT